MRDATGTLSYCITTSGKTDCKEIQKLKNVETVTSTKKGFWVVDDNSQTYFVDVRNQRDSADFVFNVEPVPTSLKDIATTSTGDVWGLLPNRSLVYRKGVTAFNPSGLPLQWKVFNIEGDELYHGYDNIFVKTKDGKVITQRGMYYVLSEDIQVFTDPYKYSFLVYFYNLYSGSKLY